MAKLKLLKKFLLEMVKIDKSRNVNMPSPMFFNDKDVSGKYHNKSQLRNSKKDK